MDFFFHLQKQKLSDLLLLPINAHIPALYLAELGIDQLLWLHIQCLKDITDLPLLAGYLYSICCYKTPFGVTNLLRAFQFLPTPFSHAFLSGKK